MRQAAESKDDPQPLQAKGWIPTGSSAVPRVRVALLGFSQFEKSATGTFMWSRPKPGRKLGFPHNLRNRQGWHTGRYTIGSAGCLFELRMFEH